VIRRFEYACDLIDTAELAERLIETGLSAEACREKAALFARAADAMMSLDGRSRPHTLTRSASEEAQSAASPSPRSRFGLVSKRPLDRPAAFFVPGRIEILGKHTDYAGGSSIVAAPQRGFCLTACARNDPTVNVTDAVWGETVQFELNGDVAPPVGHWSNYPMTVARRIARNFPSARTGAEIAFAGDLPSAAGMSSSSALIVAVALALIEVNGLTDTEEFRENIRNPIELAGYLATVENGQTFGSLEGDRGVGTFGGSEDHTAMLNCHAGKLGQYTYCPVRFQRQIAMPEGYTLAIGGCGVAAEKTGAAMAKYNAASRLAAEIAGLWRRATGRDETHLAAAVASGDDAADRLREIVRAANDDALARRLEHFLAENLEILPAAGDALAAGDLATFGSLVDRSQHAAEELLGNQISETSYLASAARAAGAAAASAFGAGFGGSVWAMVDSSRAETFLAEWSAAYHERFAQHAAASTFFTTAPGPAAFQVAPH